MISNATSAMNTSSNATTNSSESTNVTAPAEGASVSSLATIADHIKSIASCLQGIVIIQSGVEFAFDSNMGEKLINFTSISGNRIFAWGDENICS
jgi:hypothetical protein